MSEGRLQVGDLLRMVVFPGGGEGENSECEVLGREIQNTFRELEGAIAAGETALVRQLLIRLRALQNEARALHCPTIVPLPVRGN